MRSKGSHFTLGVKGLRVYLLDVAFASATVRVSPLWPCPKRVLQKRTFLEVYFQTLRKVWQAWHFVTFHSNMLHNLSKMFCATGAILLHGLQKMSCIFHGRLWRPQSSFCAAGAALQTCGGEPGPLGACDAAALCVAGVALADIHFAAFVVRTI